MTATIKGFGTACSSDELCLEISQPYHYRVGCDDNHENCDDAIVWSWAQEKAELVESGAASLAVPGEREVAQKRTTFRRDAFGRSWGVTVCHVASSAMSYGVGYGKRDGGIFVGRLPMGTPPLDLPGVTIYRFEVLSTAFGDTQIFATEPTDVTHEEFGEMVSVHQMSASEIEDLNGKPFMSPSCGKPPRR
jgi:hypothetical protein